MDPDIAAAGDIGYHSPTALHLATLIELWGSTEFRSKLADAAVPGLGTTEARVLWELGFRGPERPGTLARIIGIGAPALTKVIRRLRDRDLVVSARDSSDARASQITLTGEGRRITARLYQAGDDLTSRLMAGWNASEKDEAERVIARLVARAVELR